MIFFLLFTIFKLGSSEVVPPGLILHNFQKIIFYFIFLPALCQKTRGNCAELDVKLPGQNDGVELCFIIQLGVIPPPLQHLQLVVI